MAKGVGKKDRKKKTVAPSIESGVGSSTGQMDQGGPGGEGGSGAEAGAPPRRVRDPAGYNATQEAWAGYQNDAL